jgi:hypothetical protein
MTERRAAHRARVDIYLNNYVQGVPYMARAWDIGPGGLSLAHLIEPTHSDQRVGLQFQLPGSTELIYVEGEVVRRWSGKNCERSGVRFTLIAERHRKLILKFVQETLPATEGPQAAAP